MIHHLLFAHDLMLLIKVTNLDSWKLLEIIDEYNALYGQQVNFNKSYIYFNA